MRLLREGTIAFLELFCHQGSRHCDSCLLGHGVWNVFSAGVHGCGLLRWDDGIMKVGIGVER